MSPPSSLALLGGSLLVVAGCAASATQSASPAMQATTSAAPTVSALPSGSVSPTSSATAQATAIDAVPDVGVWQRIEASGPRPVAREAHSWTTDPETGLAYLFGGRDGAKVFGDLWVFDAAAATWTQLAPIGPAPAARFGHNAVWLPGRGLLVFAGQSGSAFYNDLWLFDPRARSWSQLPSGGDPPIPRYGSCAVLMSDGRLWTSHGFTEDRVRFADTRSYGFDSGTWNDQTPTVGDVPVARCLHACFEAQDGRFVLFGGQTTGTPALGDLWALQAFTEADRWARIDVRLPSPRNLYGHALVAGAFVVFGGGSVDGGYLSDTWAISSFDLEAAPVRTSGGPPAGRSGSSLVAGSGGRVLLFGGRDGKGALDDLWALTLGTT